MSALWPQVTCLPPFRVLEKQQTAEKLKLKKYEDLKTDYHFVPVAAETFGSWGNQAKKFLEEVGNMLIKKTEEPSSPVCE